MTILKRQWRWMLILMILFGVCVYPPPEYSRAASPTQGFTVVDEWEEIAQNAVRLGTVVNINPNYKTTIAIHYGLSSAVAHTGTKFAIQVSANTTGNEDWTTYTEFTSLSGTPNLEAMGTEAGGQTVLEVTSTTGYDADETRWIFIEDDTVADSEMAFLVSHVSNTSVTVLDGTTNAHTSADTLSNIADTVIMTIPVGYNRMRVIGDNTFDSDGATIHTKTTIVPVTALPG